MMKPFGDLEFEPVPWYGRVRNAIADPLQTITRRLVVWAGWLEWWAYCLRYHPRIKMPDRLPSVTWREDDGSPLQSNEVRYDA